VSVFVSRLRIPCLIIECIKGFSVPFSIQLRVFDLGFCMWTVDRDEKSGGVRKGRIGSERKWWMKTWGAREGVADGWDFVSGEV